MERVCHRGERLLIFFPEVQGLIPISTHRLSSNSLLPLRAFVSSTPASELTGVSFQVCFGIKVA